MRSLHTRWAVLASAAAVLWASGASAQGFGGVVPPADTGGVTPAPAPPKVTLPVIQKDEGAVYPEQALKDDVRAPVTVVLVLTIDATGHVIDAKVEAPQGHGFDESALAAAKAIQFAPATKDGKPMAARIKHKYVFLPPPGVLDGRVTTETGRPIPGASLVITDDKGKRSVATTDARGTFRLESLPLGAYHIALTAEGFVGQEADEDVGPGEEVKEIFRLARKQEKPEKVVKPPPGAAGGEIEDVYVRGKRPAREVTRRTLDQRELLRSPGTNGDALRALQNMPGIARPPGIAGILIVRGSSPQDTQIFVDGTNIPLVYHFGGLSSVVPTELLDKIDFYPGNFSTMYGRATGGIVDVGVRSPKTDKLHGMAQVDLIDARVLAEGPIGKGWSFEVAGRRSWVDAWLKPVLEATGAGVSTAPVYYDWQALLQKNFAKEHYLRVFFFGSDDRLDLLIKDANGRDPTLTGETSFHTNFWRVQALYKNRISSKTELKALAAFGEDKIDFSLGNIFFTLESYPLSGRVELSQKIASRVTANVGVDMLWAPYNVSARLPAPPPPGQPSGGTFGSRPPLDESQSGAQYAPAMYTELELTPWHGARIVPGLRLDYTKVTGRYDFAPRVVVRQDIGPAFPRTTVKGGVGVFYEPPLPQQSDPVFGQLGLKSERAIQYDVGVEREFTKNLEASVEGFYKQLDDLVATGNGNAGQGWVYGLETLIRYKPDKHFFGWIAYTLSRSTRRDLPGQPIRTAPFDQTHILTILGSYRFGHGWEVGARFRLVSGNPTTPDAYGFYDANTGSYLPLSGYPPNGDRLPLFHQLDLRVDKTWQFKAWKLGVYADVQNVYNAGNVEGTSYNYNYTQRTYATGLPFLPSIGLRGEF